MIIYKHTNKINGKSYIGLTKFDIDFRFKGHLKSALILDSPFHFHRALRKYGQDNFDSEIIEDNIQTLEEASEQEIYWISYYNTYEEGYNMTIGGFVQPYQTAESIRKGVETRMSNDSYIEGAKKRKETILNSDTSFEEIAAKSAQTKRENGFFEEYSRKIKEQGGIGNMHTCQHCGKEVRGGNYTRWHGDNCKARKE